MEGKQIIALILGAILFLAMIPFIANSIRSTRQLSCTNTTYPVYNVTAQVCFDGTNMSQGNVTRAYPDSALSGVEYSILAIVTLILIIGLVYGAYSMIKK